MGAIEENLLAVEERIAAACKRAGRDRSEVSLIAVSKTFPVEAVAEAAQAGQTLFGESRWQEAEPKIGASPPGLRWHFIGGLQRNKVRKILPLFEAIHAVDSLRLATFIDQTAHELNLSPQVFLQVNLAGETSKGGYEPAMLEAELESLMGLKHLRIAGLMAIPPEGPGARRWFSALRGLRDSIEKRGGICLPHLSMGMSGDYEEAIAEGATHVRVGSRIFGLRAYRVDGELG